MNQIKAEYIDHMGSDLTVVNAARVSFDKESQWQSSSSDPGNTLDIRDIKLINYLAKHNHFTPFTHPQITLRETVPIFVARQRFKHTVGFTYNEISRRYVDKDPEFYTPKYWRKKAPNKKQGSLNEPIELDDIWSLEYKNSIEFLLRIYKNMLSDGIAPEQARIVLPQSMMTSYYVTGSLMAFIRAYSLRSTEDAQQEIQELASQWKSIIEPLFPVTWEAFTKKE